jgi:hypothetical protein
MSGWENGAAENGAAENGAANESFMVLFWMAGAMVTQDFNQALLMDGHGIRWERPKVKY